MIFVEWLALIAQVVLMVVCLVKANRAGSRVRHTYDDEGFRLETDTKNEDTAMYWLIATALLFMGAVVDISFIIKH